MLDIFFINRRKLWSASFCHLFNMHLSLAFRCNYRGFWTFALGIILQNVGWFLSTARQKLILDVLWTASSVILFEYVFTVTLFLMDFRIIFDLGLYLCVLNIQWWKGKTLKYIFYSFVFYVMEFLSFMRKLMILGHGQVYRPNISSQKSYL